MALYKQKSCFLIIFTFIAFVRHILLFIRNTFLCSFFYSICKIVGHNVIVFNSAIGQFATFIGKFISSVFHRQFFFSKFIESLYANGFCSIPVVGLTGFFTGSVLTLQLFNSLTMFGLNDTVPYIVMFALMRELAPVLCALMVTSRVGSSMSAEIGTMKTNNQMDVLVSMSINKYRFLYFPRVLSMVISQPILTTIAIVAGIIGSFLVSTKIYGFTDMYFLNLIWNDFEWKDYILGIIKGFTFGFIISILACYKGNATKDGAVGVKNTTIATVVLNCIYILIFNFIITWIFG